MGDSYLAYKRSQFSTRLPTDRYYTKAHVWVADQGDGTARIGFTRFATRMLGEVVEFEFETSLGTNIEEGQCIGWIEGFKAVSDLYAPVTGRFAGPNPDLEGSIGDIHHFPYDRGWLYRIEGDVPDDCMNPDEYARFLDGTIDRMMGKSS